MSSHIRRLRSVAILLPVVVLAPVVLASQAPAPSVPRHQPTIAQFLKPGLPIELVSARKVDRIAWIWYEAGLRNVFTAAGPAFTPVRATSFMKDDGTDLTTLRISDDGSDDRVRARQRAEFPGLGRESRRRSERRRARDLGGAHAPRPAPSAGWRKARTRKCRRMGGSCCT